MAMSWVAEAMAMARPIPTTAARLAVGSTSAPEHEACHDHGLQRDDPGAPVPEPVRQPGYPDAVDERRPEKVDGIDADDQAGPADGGAAESVFLEPQVEAAADQHPGEPADDPEEENAGHAPLPVHRQ